MYVFCMFTMQPLHTLDSPVRTFTRDLCLSAALSHCRSLSLSPRRQDGVVKR